MLSDALHEQAISRPLSHDELVQLQRVTQEAGSLLFRVDKDMTWRAPRDGRPGRPPVFSDAAMQFCLSIKVLFKRPLRQTAGMVASLLKLAGLNWPVWTGRCRTFHPVSPAEDPGRAGPVSPRRWAAEPAGG